MATYQTKVLWTRSPLSAEENQAIVDFIAVQTPGNGELVLQPDGTSVRMWNDEASANAFAEFAKTLQADQRFPTSVVVTTIA